MTIARITKFRILKGTNKNFEALHAYFGMNKNFEALHADFAEQVKEDEPKTLYYSLCKSKADPSEFVLYEEYTDEEAMIAHGRTIHFNNEWTKMGLFIEGHPETVVTDVLTD